MTEVALITGSTRGIGLGIAKSLANAGYDLALNGVRDYDEVYQTIEELRTLGAKVIYAKGNIGNEEDRNKIFSIVKEEYKCLNIIINNAGIAPFKRNDILECSIENWDRIMDINLKGNFFMAQKAAQWFLEQQKFDQKFNGFIINISSISATAASVNRPAYCVSKAGISMVTNLFATRLGKDNIPVFEIRPGIIETDMTKNVKKKYDVMLENDLCIQNRWGQPSDVGKAVLAILKGYLPYSTGQCIMVDGGLTISRL